MKINSTVYFETAKSIEYEVLQITKNSNKNAHSYFFLVEQMQIILIRMSSTAIIKGQITRGDFEWL
jgi:hypothetical protein